MERVDGASSTTTSLLKYMETRLGSLKQHPDCAIFRVPPILRQVDPSAYEPMFVSIGPYHYTPALGRRHEHVSIDIDVKEIRPKLQQGQDLKWHFLQDFLGRNDKVSLADYISLIRGLELEARKCYIEDVSLGSDEFNQVMLLDACFVLEFFFKLVAQGGDPNRNYYQHGNNMGLNCILKDLLLLENQLPMFILEEIYNRFYDLINCPHNLDYLVLSTFQLFLTRYFGEIKVCLARRAESEVVKISSKYYHLVHLVHAHLFDPPEMATDLGEKSIYDIKICHSASTLQAMGIKIERPRNETSLFDIKFANGILQLPHHHIFDTTGRVLRNFIAFEQTSKFVDHYFSPYAFFMDVLINTVRDVDTLEKCGVLTSHIGSNENVANLFNQIGIGCLKVKSKNYFREIQIQLQEYSKVRRHRWRAKLVDDYFSNPWSILSLLAAIALLVLTALQTVFTIF